MVTATSHLLGVGIYTADEAAEYSRLNKTTMARWVWGDTRGEPIIRAQLLDSGEPERLVTFLDFIQALAIRSIRISKTKFPLQKIRKAVLAAESEYSLRFPLAAKNHRIFIFGPRGNPALCEMVIRFETAEHDDKTMQLTGKKRGNYIITEIAEPFMHGIEFGMSQFAEKYVALEYKDRQIVMDPRVRLGEPYLPSCGYTARALWEAYLSEGGIERAARAYGGELEDIEIAFRYFDILISDHAA